MGFDAKVRSGAITLLTSAQCAQAGAYISTGQLDGDLGDLFVRHCSKESFQVVASCQAVVYLIAFLAVG
jgi:hypothetical protein